MLFDNDMLNVAIFLVVAVGALNWGSIALIDYNILTDLLSLGTDMEELAHIGIGVAGALQLAGVANEVA
jgi:uncharacterized membrane protein YuzA (DUF378 family)